MFFVLLQLLARLDGFSFCLLNIEDFDTATCGLYESVFETRTRGTIGRYNTNALKLWVKDTFPTEKCINRLQCRETIERILKYGRSRSYFRNS